MVDMMSDIKLGSSKSTTVTTAKKEPPGDHIKTVIKSTLVRHQEKVDLKKKFSVCLDETVVLHQKKEVLKKRNARGTLLLQKVMAKKKAREFANINKDIQRRGKKPMPLIKCTVVEFFAMLCAALMFTCIAIKIEILMLKATLKK